MPSDRLCASCEIRQATGVDPQDGKPECGKCARAREINAEIDAGWDNDSD
jgi:hypothetical protein